MQADSDDAVDTPVGDVDTAPAQTVSDHTDAVVAGPRRGSRWRRIAIYSVLPGLALLLGLAAGYLKWVDASARDAQVAGIDALRAANDSTVAMLSYKPDTVDNDLGAAQNRLTGTFKDSYASLIRDVVIPGAKQKKIAAQARVVAEGPVSANAQHAVVFLFVDQTVTIGADPPTDTQSSVRVTLDQVGGRWLISQFDPV
jgi:Mce-associated membrane protein